MALPLFMPNQKSSVHTVETHKLFLPQCCPVSGNPQPGSAIEISYKPKDKHLEVYNLERFIKKFVGGFRCPASGEITIRQMEEMIQHICQHCANTVDVFVRVRANLVLDSGSMTLTCRTRPIQ